MACVYRDSIRVDDVTEINFAEWLIGSIRRECLDHIVVLGEAHLRRILHFYACYYNEIRTHRSLDKDAPVSRPVQRTGIISPHAPRAAQRLMNFDPGAPSSFESVRVFRRPRL
jgi:hypothetical protein